MQRFPRSIAGVVAVLALYALIVAAGQKGPSTVSAPDAERQEMAGKTSLPVTRRDALAAEVAGPYPSRGVMLGRFGLGGFGDWTVVDFDRLTIERFAISLAPDGKLAANEYSRAGRSLSVGETDSIVQEAKALHISPPVNPGSPMVVPTDTQCEVVLLDGDDVRFGHGGACPAGTERLVQMIESFGEPVRVQSPSDAARLPSE